MTIGETIRTQREILGYTLDDVGKAVGVSKATVSRWESGDIHRMKRDKISAISRFLGLDPTLFVTPQDVIYPEERDLLDAWRAADDRARADAMNTLKSHPKQSGGTP